VRFEDGEMSAPVPIAGLDRLRTASRQPLSGRFERHLRAISAQPDPDIEGYELLERLLADVEATAADRLKPVRRTAEAETEEMTEPRALVASTGQSSDQRSPVTNNGPIWLPSCAGIHNGTTN
jgi:hypothetical protein